MRILTASSNIWKFLFEFQTNSSASKTLDPYLYLTGAGIDLLWKFGDGNQQIGTNFSYTYADGTTKTVRVYRKKVTFNLTNFVLNDDNIVGTLDLSMFTRTNDNYVFQAYDNPLLQYVIFPESFTVEGKMQSVIFHSCDLQGVIDLSIFTKMNDYGAFWFQYNNDLTGFTFAPSITGKLNQFLAGYCKLTGTLDLSVFEYVYQGTFWVMRNSLLTEIIFHPTISGDLYVIQAEFCDLTGTLDLSMFTEFASAVGLIGAVIGLYQNPHLTEIIFAPSITGKLQSLFAYNCDLTGTLDLSGITEFVSPDGTTISIYSNSKLTGITFASSISGKLYALNAWNCDLQGTLDLSGISALPSTGAGGGITVYSNPDLQGITFANIVSGILNGISAFSCDLQGTIDLSMFTTIFNAAFYFGANADLQGITFASSISGAIQILTCTSCDIQGTLDLSMFHELYAYGAVLQLNGNPDMSGVTFYSSLTGKANSIQIQNCGLAGTLDLSGFTSWSTGNNELVYINNNAGLTGVTLPSTSDSLYQFWAHSCDLGYVNFTGMTGLTNRNNFSLKLQDNNMTADEVNHILVDLDGISNDDYTGRSILIGGTNAAPDTTSGGYDGAAAKTSLQSKGFTVVTS